MMLIPKHLQIETVNGYCTARCIMCTIDQWTRKPEIMDNSTFTTILEKFKPYRQSIRYLTLQLCGEPLLDKHLAAKIKIAKEMNFKGTGFATNCTELNETASENLIAAGLDTLICSIDGIQKATHESIRVGTNFEQIVSNVTQFIKLRNQIGSSRVMVRFIRQKANYSEWPAFLEYWSERINPDLGDEVVKFDVHNWGSDLPEYEQMKVYQENDNQKLICQDIYERLIIFANGDIGFCCVDDNGFFKLGNAIDDDPIHIFNNYPFTHYRTMMNSGKINELDHCKNCLVPRSRLLRSIESQS
jgi:molybdenum cofactor biosynthesis enzyme MoaA